MLSTENYYYEFVLILILFLSSSVCSSSSYPHSSLRSSLATLSADNPAVWFRSVRLPVPLDFRSVYLFLLFVTRLIRHFVPCSVSFQNSIIFIFCRVYVSPSFPLRPCFAFRLLSQRHSSNASLFLLLIIISIEGRRNPS